MLLKNIILNGNTTDILIENDKISKIGRINDHTSFIDCSGLVALPTLVDLHVHLREPGFEYKETVFTGTLAARNGGFSDVFCMPNTSPVCDCTQVVRLIRQKHSHVNLHPICAVTKGQKGKEISNFNSYRKLGIRAVSDDGMPISDDYILEKAMISARNNKFLFICHCEDKSLIKNRLNIPSAVEYSDVLRIAKFAAKTRAKVHIAHVSTKESVDIIRAAKKAGIDISAETCPHYFTLTADAFKAFGTNAMMNPPLRFEQDKNAVLEGLCDGTLDMISTDHAPHSIADKAVTTLKAPFGIIGLETSFPLSYTALVKTGMISLSALIKLMSENPAKRAGIRVPRIEEGADADIMVADLKNSFVFNKEKCLSKSRNTPFSGSIMTGHAVYTILKGDLFKCQPIF